MKALLHFDITLAGPPLDTLPPASRQRVRDALVQWINIGSQIDASHGITIELKQHKETLRAIANLDESFSLAFYALQGETLTSHLGVVRVPVVHGDGGASEMASHGVVTALGIEASRLITVFGR